MMDTIRNVVVKHPRATAAAITVASAGVASAGTYTPTYDTASLAPAIIDLIVTVIVGVASQGGTIGELVVVSILLILIGGVLSSVVGLGLGVLYLMNKGKRGNAKFI